MGQYGDPIEQKQTSLDDMINHSPKDGVASWSCHQGEGSRHKLSGEI